MFKGALSIAVKIWKPPKCSSTDEGINQIWHKHMMKYYSAVKKKSNADICNYMSEP